ncbi:unnamed protein product [Fusarium graminearum]|uniref:Apple domain-containing protein n=1 Tax=Gibberella zeae TaxID=5518 RepID=A0A9N8R7P5_GIBZA|nr:unnamed protein product [Fusarium graminearum]
MAFSRETDLSAKPGSFTTTIPTSGIATGGSSTLLSTSAVSGNTKSSSSIGIDDSTFVESTTSNILDETTRPSTLDMTSETMSSIEISATDITTTTNATTASEFETIITNSITNEDQQTTENPTATKDTTSTPIPTFENHACNELESPYQDPSGVSFEILCNNRSHGYTTLENVGSDRFTACVKFCAEDIRCAGLQYLKNRLVCATFSESFAGYVEAPDNDVAISIPDGSDTTTIEDTTTTDLSTPALVPPFVEAGCNDVSNRYNDPIGVPFDVLCNYGIYGNNQIDVLFGNIFTACVRYCALDDKCAIMHFDRQASLCILYSDSAEYF